MYNSKPLLKKQLRNKLSFTNDKEFIKELERDEGIRYKTYTDSLGNSTIGVGFNLDQTNAGKMLIEAGIHKPLSQLKSGKEILTKKEAHNLLCISMDNAIEDARLLVDIDNMPRDAARTLINVIFNMGFTKVSQEFRFFVEAMRDGQYADAADELEYANPLECPMRPSKYVEQTGERAKRQIKRLRTLGNTNG